MKVRKNQKETLMRGLKIIALLPIIFFVITFTLYTCTRYNDHEYVITITGKEHIPQSVHNEYLIFGVDEENKPLVIKNVNSYYRFKFNSSDVQAFIKEGETYIVTVYGYRIPIFDMYENIIKAEEINE